MHNEEQTHIVTEELSFQEPQFETVMLPGKFMLFTRNCLILQFIGMTFFGMRCLGVISTNLKNEKEVNQGEKCF